MDEQQFDIKFLTSREAAQAYRVTNDYIARLCRQGKLVGKFENRTWYVDTDSLARFFGGPKVELAPAQQEPARFIIPERATAKRKYFLHAGITIACALII